MNYEDARKLAGNPQEWRVTKGHSPWILILPSLLFVAGLALPVVYLVIRALEADRRITDLIFRERTAQVLLNTIALALAVSLTAALIALPLAWLTVRTDMPGARVFGPAAMLPLVIPSYVGALTYIAALGPSGHLSDWLTASFGIDVFPSIYGFTGAWLVLSLFTFPYVYLSVSAALTGIDPAHEEAARSLGKGPVGAFTSTTLRELRPSLTSGMLLAALYSVSDFGVVTLLRYDSLTRAIFVQYQSSFDRSYAAVLALILVAFAVVLVLLDKGLQGRAVYYRLGSGSKRKAKRVELGSWRFVALPFAGMVFGLSLVLPVTVLVSWAWRVFERGEQFEGLWSSTVDTLLLSAGAAVLALLAALPVSILSVRYSSAIGRFAARFAYLAYGLPGIVIALSFVFIGANYLPSIYQTVVLLLIAYVVRFSPQAVGSVRSSLQQINPRLEEAARGLGRGPLEALRTVTLPLAWPGILAGFALVFITVAKELPITLILRPTGTNTLATDVWTAAGSGALSAASGPALVLIAVTAVPSILVFSRIRSSEVRGEET